MPLLSDSETTDNGAEVEALAEGVTDEIELLEKNAVAEAEGEGEGSAGGEVAGDDEIGGPGGNSVSDMMSFDLLFSVLTKEWTGPCVWFDGRYA